MHLLVQTDNGGLRSGYYREAFKGFWGMTQVESLSPTIFNVVVDAVVRHWVFLVDEG